MESKLDVQEQDVQEQVDIVKKKIVIRWWHIVLSMIVIFLVSDQMMTNYLNDRFTGSVDYNGERGFHCEEYSDYYIMAGTTRLLVYSPIRSVVSMKNVYYDEMHKTVTVSLTIYMDKLGNLDYLLDFRDYDGEKHEYDDTFSGYAYVDSHMNYLYDDARNDLDSEYVCELMEGCEVYVERLAGIANERWGLGIEVE